MKDAVGRQRLAVALNRTGLGPAQEALQFGEVNGTTRGRLVVARLGVSHRVSLPPSLRGSTPRATARPQPGSKAKVRSVAGKSDGRHTQRAELGQYWPKYLLPR